MKNFQKREIYEKIPKKIEKFSKKGKFVKIFLKKKI